MKDFYCITRKLTRTKIAILDACEFGGEMHITRINVPKPYRHLGHASSMLHEMCGIADREDFLLTLFVMPSDGLNSQQLTDWYKRNGFIGETKLTRYPRSSINATEKTRSYTEEVYSNTIERIQTYEGADAADQ